MNIPETLQNHSPESENLLIILHDLQNNHPQQYLTKEALKEAAGYLNLTLSHVYGVAEYYSMFSLQPRGKYIIRLCISPVCGLFKVETLLKHVCSLIGVEVGQTTPDGLFTIEVSECLGQCQEAPSMMINQKVYNNLDKQTITKIIKEYNEKTSI